MPRALRTIRTRLRPNEPFVALSPCRFALFRSFKNGDPPRENSCQILHENILDGLRPHLSPSSSTMSTITRTLRNLWRVGLRDYGHQMQYIGDTKAGVLVGTDRYGNKYFENLEEELPLRTRWVDYKDRELDASQIEPGWHAWMSYLVDKPPVEDKLMAIGQRPWEPKEPKINLTQSRGAYRPYSTTKPKYSAWDPVAKPRN